MVSSTPPWRSALVLLGEALGGREHDHTRGSLHRAITLLAIPMVLEMLMESAFALVDVYFVSRLGPEAVAAVGMTESVLTLVYAVAFGLSMSLAAVVSRRIGEGDRAGAARAAAQGLVLAGLVAVAVGLPGALYGGEILRLMGADEATIAIGSGYTRVLLGTNGVILFLFLNNAVFRGAGDAALAMRSLWLANGINIALDPCLIFGWGPFPELGVTGAAVATTCGRGAGVLYQFWMLGRASGRVALRGPALELDPPLLARLVRLSLWGIAQLLVATSSWLVLMRLVAPFGAEAVAGYTIAIRIIVFALLPAWGLSNAAATQVGQNLGARQPERAGSAVWLTGSYNMLLLLAVMVVFLARGPALVRLFTSDPEVVAFGSQALRIISYGYGCYAWGMVLTQAFNGAGDTTTPTWANLACFWCCQIPLAWALSRPADLGPSGVFWAVTLAETLLALVLALLFRRGGWRTRQV
jgi:putative MATE family efflux protein